MIIFGTKLYVYQLAILTLTCRHCGNVAAHMLTKHVSKFTLFFVPLFPFSKTYATQCTFCGMEQVVPQQWAEESQAQAAAAAAAAPGEAPHYGAYGQPQQPQPQHPYQQPGA
ncbi:zinc-ribbon domain-containing protein [Streptomyces sp. NPDC002138]|uniref:zinc-ribbon domain-containing protein n=1 Tax=Streptomyces sp. NPDC002138 TaxID=3154410 RepID=UPI003330082E